MKSIAFGFALCWLAGVTAQAQLQVSHLLTENRENPQGLDVLHPRFSWQLSSTDKDIVQTAYELIVADGTSQVWKSGKITTAQNVHIPYQGPALQSGKLYRWQVRVWDNHQHTATAGTPATFRMGLLTAADWKAKWIAPGYTEDSVLRPCPIFRKQFTAKKQVVSAVANITSHGIYEGTINGAKVGNAYLTPGWTSYDKRLQYQVYEVTPLVHKGENTIEVTLASGWYRGMLGFEGNSNFYGNTVALLCQLELQYSDGTKETIVSDRNWQCTTGAIRYADLYNGEIIDARKGYDAWSSVKEVAWPVSNLVATVNEPVTTHEVFTPVKIFTTPQGDTVADFGQNLVGWVRVKVRGQAGDSIHLEHAEVLDKANNFYTANLRMARARDTYILKGEGEETFTPTFTFHGFRYVRLKGFRGGIQPAQLEAVALYSDLPRTGTFECANTLLNQLQHNIVWSQNGNFVDIPTDCPQRDERMGWMGDAMLFSRTAAYNRNVNNFMRKWLADVAGDQFASGMVPHVVPNILGEWGGAAGWADAATVVPWTMYTVYGDRQLLEKQYPSMKAWVDYLVKRTTNGLRNKAFHFGDWLSFRSETVGEMDRSALTDPYLLAQAFYAYSTQLLINAATALGKQEDVATYSRVLQQVKDAFVAEYRTPNGRLVSNTQTAYTLALQFDLLPENQRADAVQKLVENIKSYNYHITTGLLGTPYLCHVLSRYGYTDVAYQLLLQETYPSWLYPVKMGATTIWERWDGIKPNGNFQDPTMNSFNHYAYGAIGDWMYRVMAGIDMDSTAIGYKKIVIKPHPGGGLTYVKASLDTYYGTIKVDWTVNNGHFAMDVTIPANTSAAIYVPQADQVHYQAPLSIGSGTYHFESK